ncbi:alpha/beta fold hydrolase [Halobacillus naozhouensis]|uniref:Alpha/beta fold hydrolase n=1 Tax=Halobacillus naozhouensis TaxID=554880 RepID=A0ABY8J119_9BACI|nr:alpha/beta fold hydrolase [Halobacillus naozhouensis]WFT74681.1 alpha/beta fold hydrolase [Halobacillus naozhouensis]
MSGWKRDLIKTNRGVFEVFTQGSGPPLCVTHLYSQYNESGDYFAETFTDTNTVYIVNLRESGGSAKAEEPYQLSMLESVFDLEAIREALSLKQWGFAGHSTGGMLGVVYGIRFSEHLNFLVIAGAAAREYMTFSEGCIYNDNHPQFQRMQNLIEALKSSELSKGKRQKLTVERTRLSLHKPDSYEELFCRNIHKKMSAVRMNYFVRELPIFDVSRKLSFIKTPVLITCGEHDVQCPLEYSLEMKEFIPNSELVVFEHSNHYPFVEEETKFKRAVATFLYNHGWDKEVT